MIQEPYSHLMWVGHHFYCQIMWAQTLLDCGSWRLSLRAGTAICSNAPLVLKMPNLPIKNS